MESENSTDKVEEPKAKKLKLEDETKLQTDSNDRSDTKTTQKKKKKAYILFVGNLPYTVSAEEIREHFSKTGMSSLHLTSKFYKNILSSYRFFLFRVLRRTRYSLKFPF